MVGTTFWLVVSLGLFPESAITDENVNENACVYLLPIYVNNIGFEYLEFDAEYIPTNYTAVLTNLEFICDKILNAYHELVVGEIMNCAGDSLENNTFDSIFAGGTTSKNEILSRIGDLNTSATTTVAATTNSVTTMTNHVTTMKNAVTIMENTRTIMTNTGRTTAGDYRIGPNITYRNITDMCPSQKEQSYWQQEASNWINRIYPKVLLVIGFLGNTLAFVTILRMKPVKSLSLLIAVLAISDNCMLITKNTYFELMVAYDSLSNSVCGFIVWMSSGIGMFSVWLVVLMTIERLFAVWFPFRAMRVCTNKNTLIAMTIACVVLMGVNSHMMWTIIHDGGAHCVINPDFETFWIRVGVFLYPMFVSVFPFLILIICNFAIIFGMRRSETLQQKMNAIQQNAKSKTNSRQATVMLLSISFTFLILSAPLAIFMIIRPRWDPAQKYVYAKLLFVDSLINLFADMNNAINFYMYFLTGRKFRKQLYGMFGCCRSPKRSFQGTSGATSSRSTSVSMVSRSSCNNRV